VNFFSLAGALLHIWPYITHVHWQSATSQPPLINPALFDARAPAAQRRTARAPTIAIESKKQTTDNRIPCSSAPHGGRIFRTTRLLSTSELHYFGTRGRAEILPGVKVGGNAARRENIICRRTQKNHENVKLSDVLIEMRLAAGILPRETEMGQKKAAFLPPLN
jgi:hypothetical protein